MDGITGVMAFAASGEGTPEIRLPIKLKGPHRIFVGINYTRSNQGDFLHHSEWPLYGQLQLKLDGDVGFPHFALIYGWRGSNAPARVGKDSEVYRSMQEMLHGVRLLFVYETDRI
jgi:hypothetical protein